MADERGRARALMVLTPVGRGREPELRAALRRLPTGEDSPLARLPGTHFARFVIVPGGADSVQLLFSATHDELQGSYLEELRGQIPDHADAIWGHCEGYPGSDGDFVGYMERHRVTTHLFVAAYADATLDEVLEGLELRRRLMEFAPGAQWMAPEELRGAFRREVLGGSG